MFAYELAAKLGVTLKTIYAMDAAEFYGWAAFYSLTPDDRTPVEDKLRKRFGKPANG